MVKYILNNKIWIFNNKTYRYIIISVHALLNNNIHIILNIHISNISFSLAVKYCAMLYNISLWKTYITTTYKIMHFALAYSYNIWTALPVIFFSNTKPLGIILWILPKRCICCCSRVFHSHFEANLRLLTDKTFVVVKASSC